MNQPTTPGPDHHGWTHGVPGRDDTPVDETLCPNCGVRRCRKEILFEECEECGMGKKEEEAE